MSTSLLGFVVVVMEMLVNSILMIRVSSGCVPAWLRVSAIVGREAIGLTELAPTATLGWLEEVGKVRSDRQSEISRTLAPGLISITRGMRFDGSAVALWCSVTSKGTELVGVVEMSSVGVVRSIPIVISSMPVVITSITR